LLNSKIIKHLLKLNFKDFKLQTILKLDPYSMIS
jgi:hypothetical protein